MQVFTQRGRMVSVWILSVHNLHCPECGSRLIERAGRYIVPGRPQPVHVGEVGTLRCPGGHSLPDRAQLYAHREAQGLPRSAEVWEVAPPSAATPGPISLPGAPVLEPAR